MVSLRSFALGVGACALAAVALGSCGVNAGETLTVTQPSDLYSSSNGYVYQKPSLFGLPNFREKIAGQVIYPQATTNRFGCAPYAPFLPQSENGNSNAPTIIALIDRGNCSFATKVANAQDAGASAVIVVNDDAKFGAWLPYLSADSAALDQQLHIPAMIIRSVDGDKFKGVLNKNDPNQDAPPLMIAMEYFLPAPDDRVEIDYYTYSGDPLSTNFKRQYREVVSSMGEHVLFEPHYQILNTYLTNYGWISYCAVTGASCSKNAMDRRCGTRCTNCGRYCQNDPDGIGIGATGADVVLEQLRSKCVWQYGNDTNYKHNTYWFDYQAQHDIACKDAPHLYDAACSMKLITSLGIPESYMTKCVGNTGFLVDAAILVAEADVDWARTYQPLPPPELFVNNQHYHGDLSCQDPINPASCPTLAMICVGFQEGTDPPPCRTSIGCPLGQQLDACNECGGDGTSCVTKGGGGNKFPVGAVIGIVIACCVLIGVGVFLYLRRQQAAIKDDIDSLLKQYLPLEAGMSTNGERNASRRIDASRLLEQHPSDSEH